MVRRLPVYLVLDTSGSMSGEPIEAIKNGMQVLVSALRQDPYALETAYLSVITFDTHAKQVVPLTDLLSFQEPDISAKGITSMGEALSLLSDCIEKEVNQKTETEKGDWKPIIFIMTDGTPTDDWEKGLEKFKKIRKGVVVACAAGSEADTSVLSQITNDVVRLDTTDTGTIKAFFKWISSSVSSTTKSADNIGKELGSLSELPPPPPEINLVN